MAFLPIFDAVAPVINKVLAFIPDPQQKLEAQQELMTGLMAWDAQQTQINAVEAANSNLFVSGWRPAVGWTCTLAFAYKFVLEPLIIFLVILFGIKFDVKLLPTPDWTEMYPVLLGMLGLAGARTYEKVQGIK